MREAYAHDAVLTMGPEADLRAPGAAITAALCGHWEHEPPCPLSPHHTRADRRGAEVHLRTLFAAEPALEATVRAAIDGALTGGALTGPDGEPTTWQRVRSGSGEVADGEREHAARLARG
jgi:hypothetical protein